MSRYIIDDRENFRFKVNREVMADPAVLADERQRIFDRCWLYVGHESELRKPNDFKTRTVGGRPLIFSKDTKGAIRVFVNSCPHRGAMVCREPSGNARFLTCFYHGWSFDSSGKLVSVPDEQGYPATFERPGLTSPPHTDSYRGFVFVCFDPQAASLDDYLAGAKEYIDLVCDQSDESMDVLRGTHEYSVKANWKLLIENSYDGYHAVSTHQRYLEMMMAAGKDFASLRAEGRGIDLGNGHAVMATAPSQEVVWGRPLSGEAKRENELRHQHFRDRYGDEWGARMTGARNLVVFPNLVLIDLVMGAVIRTVNPISEDYMEVSAWELVPREDGKELRKQRMDNFLTFWGPGGLASPDDVEALETCQRSFAARGEVAWSDISRGMSTPVARGVDELQMRTWWRESNRLITSEVSPEEPHEPLAAPFIGARQSPKTAALAD